MKKPKIELTNNEALVLVEFLLRFRDRGKLSIEDEAEEQMLWDLCVIMEIGIPELLDKNYKDLLAKASGIVKSGDDIE